MYGNREIMTSIIRYLNSLGCKTSTDKEFNKSSIGRILNNKKYIGVYLHRDIETPDGIPRIIEDELFGKVQQELTRNGLVSARNRANFIKRNKKL
jgi:site-specific DNA recombinase